MVSVDSFAEKDSLISAPCLATKIYIPLSSSTKSCDASHLHLSLDFCLLLLPAQHLLEEPSQL